MTTPTTTAEDAVPECPVRFDGITFTARRTSGTHRWQVFAGCHLTPVGYLETDRGPGHGRGRVRVFDAANQPLGTGPAATYAHALCRLHARLAAVGLEPFAVTPDLACSRV
ncbi:MAG: hypothetical protein GXX79_08525 [Actinomycetales bacterium]|nr:hypothetical protein [Actinomycetales bacterium]